MSDMLVCDLHNDILTSGLSDDGIKAYLDNALKYCEILTMAVWTSESKPSLLSLREIFAKYSEYAKVKEGRGRVVFAVEDMGFLEQSSNDKAQMTNLDEFLKLPMVYAGLVWNNGNQFGGGAFSDTGLTAAGKAAVRLFNSSGIALDFAHMNKKTFYQAADLYKKPILCSHTCFQACVDNNAPLGHIARARNLDDGQVKTIVQSGGLIGLTFVATFLNGTPDCSSDDIVRHIDWFVQKYGYKNLAIGTDYFGTKELPRDVMDYKDFNVIADKLLRLGYNAEAVSGIFSGNFQRFLYSFKVKKTL